MRIADAAWLHESGRLAHELGYCEVSHGAAAAAVAQFAVVDHGITLTGSFNLTAAASTHNFENVLIVSSSSVASAYASEFDSLWGQGVAL